jgi:hypothetical protein
LLALQVVDITLLLRIGHAFVTTLRILRQPIVILAALAIRHVRISALFVTAEPSEFKVDRRVRAESTGVARIEPTVAIVATGGAGVAAPIGRFEPSAVIPPISLLRRPIIAASLILKTLGVIRIDHGVEAADNVGYALCRRRLHSECGRQSNNTPNVK